MTVSVIGAVQLDVIASPVGELPAPGAALFVDKMAMRVGGAGANAALAMVELGLPTRLFGCVGDDFIGRQLLAEIGDLATDVLVVPGQPTGVTVACEKPGRDRSFLTLLGVCGTYDFSMVPTDALSSEDLLICDYFCAPALRGEPTRKLLEGARAQGARTFFDTAWDPDGFGPQARAEVHDLLPLVDIFLPNEDEACALSGESDPHRAAHLLQEISAGWVVVKLGAAGCYAAGPDGVTFTEPAPKVEVADTTGAGDTFNAGLVDGLRDGQPLREALPAALRSAIRFASAVVSRPSSERYAPPKPLPDPS
jgi:argininosuccinate lyase